MIAFNLYDWLVDRHASATQCAQSRDTWHRAAVGLKQGRSPRPPAKQKSGVTNAVSVLSMNASMVVIVDQPVKTNALKSSQTSTESPHPSVMLHLRHRSRGRRRSNAGAGSRLPCGRPRPPTLGPVAGGGGAPGNRRPFSRAPLTPHDPALFKTVMPT